MNTEANKITCIAMFDNQSLDNLKKYFENINFKLCKLKYNEKDREEKDLLPFHSTICVWKNKNSIEIKRIIENIGFNKFKLKIAGTKIKKSIHNSYNLYFEFEKSEEFTNLQELIYSNKNLKVEKYNPKSFIPHITIHIDKDYQTILRLQTHIMNIFKPFDIVVSNLGIYEIYPPRKIM